MSNSAGVCARALLGVASATIACAVAASLATPAAAASLTRGPYLQKLTTRSVTVVWNTDVAAACSLTLRPSEGTARVIEGKTGTRCTIAIDDLAPGSRYAYTPHANGVPLHVESSFRTDDPGAAFTFLVLGDSGCACRTQLAVRDRMLASRSDFILHTGDLVYERGEAHLFDAQFFTPYKDLVREQVLWPCRGNHDVKIGRGAAWQAAFLTPANNPARSEHYYSFDFGNAHVVVLDSTGDTKPGSAQHAFLDHDLAASTATWKFVVLHHPLYSSGVHGGSRRLRRNLVPLLDRHGVDLVFNGHDHHYERTKPLSADRVVKQGAGTVYVTTGGGGRSVRRTGRSPFTAYAESAFHFTRVAVDGDTLRLEMVRQDGAVRDAASMRKSGARLRADARPAESAASWSEANSSAEDRR